MIDKKTLQTYQNNVKFRFKRYQHGHQQGLGMIWTNMMNDLKQGYEKTLNKA
ncbi:MAG: hypothetical protein [Bacteriophage sp.]|nr:MAG: hypothetical protein [Bacteriophage sp.]